MVKTRRTAGTVSLVGAVRGASPSTATTTARPATQAFSTADSTSHLDALKPGGGSWTASSDVRLKKDVKPLEGGLERLLKLRGVNFEWIEPEKQGNLTGTQIGMIAQEVEQVFPEWVRTDEKGYKTLTFRGFEALTVEGMRTLHNDNLSLRRENEALRHQVGDLEDRMKKVEAKSPELAAGYGSHGFAALGGIALGLAAFFTSRRRLPPSSVS